MPSYYTRNELKELCSDYGILNDLIYKSGGIVAFAHFKQMDAARKAKIGLDRFPLGENTLSVNLIEDEEEVSVSG